MWNDFCVINFVVKSSHVDTTSMILGL